MLRLASVLIIYVETAYMIHICVFESYMRFQHHRDGVINHDMQRSARSQATQRIHTPSPTPPTPKPQVQAPVRPPLALVLAEPQWPRFPPGQQQEP